MYAAGGGSVGHTQAAGHMQFAVIEEKTLQVLANAFCGCDRSVTNEVHLVYYAVLLLLCFQELYDGSALLVQVVSAQAAHNMVKYLRSQLPAGAVQSFQ